MSKKNDRELAMQEFIEGVCLLALIKRAEAKGQNVQKPFSILSLSRRIRQLLHRRQAASAA